MGLRGLDGKVAIVTGAAAGIGAASALRLSEEGCSVVLVDIDPAAEAVAAELPGEAIAVNADITGEAGVDSYMEAAVDRFGRVDAVHLNAGYSGQVAPVVSATLEDFEKTMAINVRAVFLGMRAAIGRFYEQRSPGGIVVTTSTASFGGANLFAGYVASKHAALGLVRSAALEVVRDGIRINAICPGLTETQMARSSEEKMDPADRARARELLESKLPLGRYAQPAEMASAAAWLLSDESSYVNAETILVDGGRTAAVAGYQAAATTS
jgi:NAD(P)-dependent dehydrogenase (short-subunit alcohol dehydrogenase family)